MLSEFLLAHRSELLALTREKVAARSAPQLDPDDLEGGVPTFLDQLGEALRSDPIASDAIARSAGRHGRALSRAGFTAAQVVHQYGDLCQAVTELAAGTNVTITTEELCVLTRCLDDAIAEAVTGYTTQHERTIADTGTHRLGTVVHEVRGRLSTALMAISILENGQVGISGSTGAVLKRSLERMSTLLELSFAQVRQASR